MVLAFKGTDSLTDFYADFCEVFVSKLGEYSISCHTFTKEAVEMARKNGYELSMTGHSLGAYLAVLSLYYSHLELKYANVRAVVFESPGTKEILENVLIKRNVITHLNEINVHKFDIITYLHDPNPINTCNGHVGRVVHIKMPDTNKKSSNGIKWIKWILPETIIKMVLKFKDIEGHYIDGLINEFDLESEKLDSNKASLILDWPKVISINGSTFVDYFERKDKYNDKSDLQLKYETHYRTYEHDGIDKDLLNSNSIDDSYLLHLYKTDFSKHDKTDFIVRQLEMLKECYTIEIDHNEPSKENNLIIPTRTYKVDDLREIINRLKRLSSKVTDILDFNKGGLNNADISITDYFGGIKLGEFVKTEDDIFDRIDGLLERNQYMFIYGQSGHGKTTLAREYAYYKKQLNKDLLIQFIISGDLNSILIEMSRRYFGDNDPLTKSCT